MTKEAVMRKIRRQIEFWGSQTKAAASLGITAQYLNDVLSGKREPAGKLLNAMGLERVVTYKAVAK